MPSSSSALSSKPRKPSSSAPTSVAHHHQQHSSSPLFCRHHSLSATATLDLLILILVLFSGTFLLTSYFSYLFHSLSLLLPPVALSASSPFPLLLLLLLILSFAVAAAVLYGGGVLRSRKCENPKCKGLKKAMEFDLQLQTEESLKSAPSEIDRLPWKGGSESNPDYECLRAELRKMAPPNGRAVLLFRARCGCPLAKLVGWGPKKGRKHKNGTLLMILNLDHFHGQGVKMALADARIERARALANVAVNGDYR
ncbi:hypothetical protein Cgig2_000866 [Carnegiea gigantea]|uniref:Ribosomal protein L34e superfamily protein n=1 Tax=Carnegiea gigantea TaxID=171969 RepID=A0A9Q1QAC6_9CARY|nr:hypothetical protein Cgig2_000866 [Carnegiea gigantea]